MNARLVLPGIAPKTEWLQARRYGVTASEIAVVMGLAPGTQNSPWKLYYQKTGDLPEDGLSDVMERGKVLEPYVVTQFLQRYPYFNVSGDGRTLYAHSDRAWQMATPDRFLWECGPPEYAYNQADPLAGLECKTATYPDEQWGDDGSDEVPAHYALQVLWNMDIFDVTTWYLACQFMSPWHLRVYEFTMCAEYQAHLKLAREEARDFLDRIDLRDPPPVDWAPATGKALRRLHPDLEDRDVVIDGNLARWYAAACRDKDAAERRQRLYANRILERLGNAHRAVTATGRKVATRSVSTPQRVDLAQLRAQYPQAAKACTHPPQDPVVKLTPAKGES